MKSSKRSGKLLTNEYKIWLGKNPLTVWMKRHRKSQMEVAARMGVSTYAVYLWQHGTSTPNPERFVVMRELTELDDIIEQWAKWKNSFKLTKDERK